ncbi:hypothetical protein Tco_0509746 [Tanacetum coccineum]
MSITNEQQQALDYALVPREQRLKIGSCNYKLNTTFKPKEPTFQVALDNTASYHKHTIRFKLNKKSYSFDLDTFRNMLQICPKLPRQHFVDTPFEEDILAFLRELGYSRTIKLLSDVKVYLLPQPWRTFATIINKCRSDLVYQIGNKESRKNKRNKVDWHMAIDDPILTTMRFIPHHEVVQKYGAILLDYLITPAMKESEAFKTYYAFATRKATPKLKLKVAAKGAKSGKKRQPARGLETLSEVALTEAEQLRIVTKRSLIQTHSSHASGSGAHEGTGVTPGVPDVPTYESDDEEISWKTSSDDVDDNEGDDDAANDDHDDADNDSERTESDNEGDEFVHPKFTTHDEDEKEEKSSDPRVHTPSQSEPSENEENVDVAQSKYTKEEEVNAKHTYKEEDANDLYRDLNVNLEGRDADMTDAPQTTQVIGDTHVTLTPVNPESHQQSSSVSSGFISNMLNPNPDTGIDSILNTESTSLVEIPDLPNFGSLFGFDNRLKALEQGFSEFIQTNQYATALSSILNIVDNYLGSKLKEIVNVAVQLKSDRIREEAQAENEDFLNKIDDNIKKIIKDQVKKQVKAQVSKIVPRFEKLVNEQLESEVMIRSSNEANTSHAVAASLSELELKKILIDKMEANKLVDRTDIQKNLYKALVDAYKADKDILDAYGDTRRRTGKEPESASAPREKTSTTTGKSIEGSKSHQQSEGQSALAEVPMHIVDDFEDPTHQELPSPDRDWNKTVPANLGPVQPWLSNLARQEDPRESFDELMDTPFDFSAFMMNRLKVDTLTPELLVGPTFELMKGTCKSLFELEYFFVGVYKATTEQLDWTNPEGQFYPHDLRKPLPLIPNSRGRQVIPFAHFINNDLAYLSGGVSSRTYSTSVTKTKAADYGNIKESTKDVYSRRRIIAVMKHQIVEWHGYKHLDWITVRRADDKLYSFKEGDFKRLCLQDIKDISYDSEDRQNAQVKEDNEESQKKDSILQAGNPVKEILLKLNLPDHRILKDGSEVLKTKNFKEVSVTLIPNVFLEVLKLKNFKKDATLKLFKSTNQERYEHVSPEVTSSQDGQTRLCLVDDLNVFKITFKTS